MAHGDSIFCADAPTLDPREGVRPAALSVVLKSCSGGKRFLSTLDGPADGKGKFLSFKSVTKIRALGLEVCLSAPGHHHNYSEHDSNSCQLRQPSSHLF